MNFFSNTFHYILDLIFPILDLLFSNAYPTLEHYLILSIILFAIGACGVILNKRNIINILMSIELMLLSVNINFISFSIFLNNISGQIFTIFILTVAAAEAAIGLAILVVHFKNKINIDVEQLKEMRG